LIVSLRALGIADKGKSKRELQGGGKQHTQPLHMLVYSQEISLIFRDKCVQYEHLLLLELDIDFILIALK
jgi:hypothetical protein